MSNARKKDRRKGRSGLRSVRQQRAGQLLGYLVSAREIEADPEKIQAILTMQRPAKLHDVQKLAGRVAALSRFISKLGEKALPFYKLMKKANKFEWTPEAEEALKDLKKMLTTPPYLLRQRRRNHCTCKFRQPTG